MALANLASLTLFADGVVAHAADLIVGVVVVAAVGAGDGMRAGSETVLPGLVVDVGLGALDAFLAVVYFLMVASALATSDLAGWVDFVSVFPAPGTLHQQNPRRQITPDIPSSGQTYSCLIGWGSPDLTLVCRQLDNHT